MQKDNKVNISRELIVQVQGYCTLRFPKHDPLCNVIFSQL